MLIALSLAAALAAAPPSPPPQAPAPQVTLGELVAQARRSSPLRGAAVAAAAGTREAATLAGRPLNPLVELRSENWTPAPAASVPLDIFLTITQPFELGGKRTARRALANADRDIASASLGTIDHVIVRQTVAAYMEALRARGVLATLATNREGLATLITAMRRRVTEGTAAESDLLRFEAEDARLTIDIARATVELDRSLGTLTLVSGAQRRIEPAQLVEPPLVRAPDSTPDAVAQAISRRPEVTEAGARAERARQVLAVEKARRVPDPAITTGYKRTSGATTLVAAVTATVPLFDKNSSATARATGELASAGAEREAIAARLTTEADALIRAAQTLAARSAESEQMLLTPATGVRDAARAAFREGTFDVLKLIDAERVYSDVQRIALELRLQAIGAAIDARLALGEEPLP